MKAEEARKVTELSIAAQNVDRFLEIIYKQIAWAAERGRTMVQFQFHALFEKPTAAQEKIISERLCADGYRVEFYHTGGRRHISW